MLKGKQLQIGLKWIVSHKIKTCIMCESVKKICMYIYLFIYAIFFAFLNLNIFWKKH